MNSNNQAVNWLIEKGNTLESGEVSFKAVIPVKMYNDIADYVRTLPETDRHIVLKDGFYNWKEDRFWFSIEINHETGKINKSAAYYDKNRVLVSFNCGLLEQEQNIKLQFHKIGSLGIDKLPILIYNKNILDKRG